MLSIVIVFIAGVSIGRLLLSLTVGKHRAVALSHVDATTNRPRSHSNSRTISCHDVDDLLHGFVDEHILGLQWTCIKAEKYYYRNHGYSYPIIPQTILA
jgi:hypothetical protein